MKNNRAILVIILVLVALLGVLEYSKKKDIDYLSSTIVKLNQYRAKHKEWPSDSDLKIIVPGSYIRGSNGEISIRYSYGIFKQYSMFISGHKNGSIDIGTY